MRKLGAVLVLLVLSAPLASAQKVLSLSDIHFNPFADPSLVSKLEAAEVAQWDAILASSAQTGLGTYGSDINDALLRSAIAEMKKQIPSPAFVMISGDFLAHGFDKNYQQYATDKSQTAYTAFVTKTIAYIARRFRDAFPDAPFYPTLGNNDSDCGDYAVTPKSTFLANFRDIWSPMVRSRLFDLRFPTGGYYHADVPALDNIRIIALNTTFFSTKYKDTCGKPDLSSDPGKNQLAWLDGELRLARDQRKNVWLLFHIPPGLDVYDTEKWGSACPSIQPQPFWNAELQAGYLRILKMHSRTIVGSFAGHTHQDEFRFADGNFIHITPSITPIFGNNPAFQIVDARPGGGIVDYVTHHLPNVTAPWAHEYRWGNAYAKPWYNATTLTQLATEIANDTGTREKYFDNFTSRAPKSSAAALAGWRGYWCGFENLRETSFKDCYCRPQ